MYSWYKCLTFVSITKLKIEDNQVVKKQITEGILLKEENSYTIAGTDQ